MSDSLARKVIKILCNLENQDTFISPLLPSLAVLGGKPPDKQSLVTCLQAFPHIFKLETGAKSETKISLQIHVKICKLHQIGLCQSDTNCDGIHICSPFLLSGACPKQGPENCPQVHQIHTPHNLKLLQTYLLDKLSKDEIRSVFKHARNRTRSMLPPMCSSYMEPAGCPNENCPKLHLCQKLLLSNCNAGCTKNHHNVDQRTKEILEMYGLDTTKSSKEIIKALIAMNQCARISYPQPLPQSSPGDEQKTREDGKDQQQKETVKKEKPSPSFTTSSGSGSLARTVVDLLCEKPNCECSVQTLLDMLAKSTTTKTDYPQLKQCFEEYADIFSSSDPSMVPSTVVKIQTKVVLCDEFMSKKGQCEKERCNELHICRYFLLSDSCKFQSPKKPCLKGHDLDTSHNRRVLRLFCLDHLNMSNIRKILQCPRNRTQLTTPDLCRQFGGKGCNSKTNCNFLHLCRGFLYGTCKRGDGCHGHDIHAPEVAELLTRYGVDMNRMEKEILEDLKTMIANIRPKSQTKGSKEIQNEPKGRRKDSSSEDGKKGDQRSQQPRPGQAKPNIQGSMQHSNDPSGNQFWNQSGHRMPYGNNPSMPGHPYENQRPPFQYPPPPRYGPPQGPPQGHAQGPSQGYPPHMPPPSGNCQGPQHPQANQWNPGNASAWQHQQQWNQQAPPPPGYGHFHQGQTPPFQGNFNIPPPSSQQQPNQYQQQQQQQQQQYHTQQQQQSNPSSASQKNPPQSPDPPESQGQQQVRDKSGICMQNFRKCYLGEKCGHHHKKMIYQWQMRLTEEKQERQTWSDFDTESNLQLETAYCDPKEETCLIAYRKGDIVTVNFEDMTGSSKRTKMAVRRLSTPSSEAPNLRPTFYRWSNVWRWFWQDENGTWNEYGVKDKQTFASDKTSETIELAYLANASGSMDLNTSGFVYRLMFDQMIQMNVSTSTQRPVRRRPKFFTKDDLKTRATPNLNVGTISGPASWSTGRIKKQEELAKHYAEIKLNEKSEEYQKVSGLFYETLPQDRKIHSVERIENGELWMNFDIQREKMKRKAGKSTKVAERSLFHGTTQDKMEAICRQGFDFRFSGFRVGAIHGKGSYFAKEAKYSDNYAEKSEVAKKMFVARVLVGEYTRSDKSYVRPPAKGADNPHDLYDSCVDDMTDPKIFVIFTLEQAYPEYIITYT